MHPLVVVFFISSLCSSTFVSYVESRKSLITHVDSSNYAFENANGNSEQVQHDTKQSGFSIELIHRDSPLSPFYDPSKTQLDFITNVALRSNSRANQLSLSLLPNNYESKESILIPNTGEYLMRFYIGTPPIERLVIADTGSDLTWVQCSPCLDCFQQETPLYNKVNSSTFTNVPCLSQSCTQLPPKQQSCGPSQQCLYTYKYGDQSFSIGELITDSINFGSNNASLIKPITFGCGYSNKFTNAGGGKSSGLVGLGAGPLSLVSQLGDSIGRKFSYCLLPFDSNTSSKIKFGSESTILENEVVSTPIISKPSTPTFYFLNLEGVTVGEKRVQSRHLEEGNIIIDSGSTFTYLEPSFYYDFVTLLKEILGDVEVKEEGFSSPLKFCFTYQENMSFPFIVFHFTGANITLKPRNYILRENSLVCLAMVPSNFPGVSIFGNLAQIDFHVEYDVGGGKVSFSPTDCTKY